MLQRGLIILAVALSVLVLCLPCKAQFENHIWYMGKGNAGVVFDKSTSRPSGLSDKYAPYGQEGSLVVTDHETMELLFYSDGERILNRQHQVMKNGSNLGGHPSSAQAALSCPVPGDCRRYYLFSNGCSGNDGTDELRYSIVNMNGDGGLGEVELQTKGTLMRRDVGEGMAIMPRPNTSEYWLVVNRKIDNTFYVYRIHSGGISLHGTVSFGPADMYVYNIKYSAVAGKLGVTTSYAGYIFILDFDAATGLLANYRHIDNLTNAYDCEWSPDGTKFYYSSGASNFGRMELYQFDLKNGQRTRLFSSTGFRFGGGLKLGPDGSIYHISDFYNSYLGRIESPNIAGKGCNYIEQYLNVGTPINGLSLPAAYYPPAVTMGGPPDTTVCEGHSVALIARGGVKYTWSPSDGLSCTDCAEPFASPAATTTYKVDITGQSGCTRQDEVTVSVLPSPQGEIMAVRNIAKVGEVLSFQGSARPGEAASWEWLFGDKTTDTAQSTSHAYKDVGFFRISMIVRNALGCPDTASYWIQIVPDSLHFVFRNRCEDRSVTFTPIHDLSPDSIEAFIWHFGDSTSETSPQPTHIYAEPGSYAVRLTIRLINGTQYVVDDTVRIYPRPVADFEHNAPCEGHAVHFTSTSQAQSGEIVSWQWWQDDQFFATTPSAQFVFPEGGSHSIRLVVINSLGCVDSIEKIITVAGVPTARFSFTPDQPKMPWDNTVTFTADTAGCAEWLWSINEQTAVNTRELTQIFDSAGTYQVSLIVVNANGCTDTMTRQVEVKEDFIIWIPTAFSPNGDSLNAAFEIEGYGIDSLSFFVFNRWGEEIYQTSEKPWVWDGKLNGAVVPLGRYGYKAIIRDMSGTIHYRKGYFYVVR